MTAVAVTAEGLEANSETVRWLSGSIHYWRHDPGDWPRLLDGARALGLTMIDTYVPWEVHCADSAEADFSAGLDVARFLELAAGRGLHASIRPGPACGAELTTHGYPRRVVDRPECQGLRCSGRPYVLPSASHFFRVPSYASSAFRAEVRGWYRQVGEHLASLQAPAGPIVAVQVDNEMGYFFQAHAYALDYHPECLDQWREFVLQLHGSLDAVNRAYSTRATGPGDLEPPRDGSDPVETRRVEWLLFREQHIRATLAELRQELRDAGFDSAVTFHNDYARTETPLDQRALESSGTVEVAGIDAYSSRAGGAWLTDIGRHLATSSRLPLVPELGAGWIAMPWVIPAAIRPEDQEMVTLSLFAAGVRGANFYMLADRDRWYGSPIDIHGNLRDAHSSIFRRLVEFVCESRLEELQRVRPLLILEPRAELRRQAAKAVMGAVVPAYREVMPFDFRLADPASASGVARSWTSAFRDTARRAGVDYDLGVSSSPPDLSRYEVVAVPVVECLDRALAGSLDTLDEAKTQVLFGGGEPRLDERLISLDTVPRGTRVRSMDHIHDHLPRPESTTGNPDVPIFEWRGEGRSVLIVLNHSSTPVSVPLTTSASGCWRELWPSADGRSLAAAPTTAHLPGYGARAWEVAG
ncbi:MAG: hypothetical protein NVS3B24_06520 [Candidatus Dormibacteria bacterium]